MAGDLKYWVDGFPFGGVKNASADELTVKYWIDGFPQVWLEAAGGVSEISGSALLSLSGSGTLGGTGALAGSSILSFAAASSLTGDGALVGGSIITVLCSGAIIATGACVGSITLSITTSGITTSADPGSTSGSCSLTLSCSAVINSTTEAIVEVEIEPEIEEACDRFRCDTCELETVHPVIRNTGYRLTPTMALELPDRPRGASQGFPVSYVQPGNIALVKSRKRLKR